MNFVTFEFLIFFTLILILNWFLKKWPLAWRLFLLLSGYFFYFVWDFRFLLIVFLVSVFNFISGLAVYKNLFGKRKTMLIISVVFNIFVLGVFKYYDFFRVAAESLLNKIGLPFGFPLLEIILPIGLSFYIFRAISYNADIYLKKIPACFSLLDFLIYISFFPHLLSGPIMRAGNFLIQLKNGGSRKIENLQENITLILIGLFKKLVISSYLVLNITDDVFAVPENHSGYIILLAVFAYSLVIYFDFSGYSDMAIGFAGLMGFKSPVNFNRPYLALNIRDFWRRWHISLSGWIRDYVYIPLGGNRKGEAKKYLNLMTAMVLIGFWHGPAFHFIAWGALQGFVLIFSHRINFSPKKYLSKLFCWFLTFNFISFSWIFFRSKTIKDGFVFIKNIFISGKNIEALKVYVIVFLAVGFLLFLFEKQITFFLAGIQKKLNTFFWIIFVIAALILILKFSPDTVPQFIYFNF